MFIRTLTSYAAGVVTGILYASYKYEKNPNEIFKGWGDTGKAGAEAVKNSAENAANAVKEKFSKKTGEDAMTEATA